MWWDDESIPGAKYASEQKAMSVDITRRAYSATGGLSLCCNKTMANHAADCISWLMLSCWYNMWWDALRCECRGFSCNFREMVER